MDTQKELIQLKNDTGYNWREFAAYFDIPYRTMQDWYLGKRKMPNYLLQLMYYKINIEKTISKDADDTKASKNE